MGEYNSVDMAIKALLWLHKNKRIYIHCTEYGSNWLADAIGYNGKELFEIEVKTSWTDFKADFTGKKQKHATYAGEKDARYYDYKPNYMWYLLSHPHLKDKALKFLEKEGYNKYGILVLEGDEIVSVKNARRLHSKEPSQKIINGMIRRMSNEYLFGISDIKYRITNTVQNALDQILVNNNKIARRIVEGD
jgi:hypothetical protein